MYELMSFSIDGERFCVLELSGSVLFTGDPSVKVALVSDTVSDLLSIDSLRVASIQLFSSVRRRGITPAGVWVIGTLPVDWPLWQDYLDPKIAEAAFNKQQEINGHVRVYALIDSATLNLAD